MLGIVVKKELKEFWRMPANKSLLVVYILLLCITAAAGSDYYSRRNTLMQDMQARSYQQFLNQGNKDPHEGAHFGFYAFKQMPLLAAADGGIEQYVGGSYFLEPHKAGTPKYKDIGDATELTRMGYMNIGYMCQYMLPLFIFFICYNVYSKEWEYGTLRIALGFANTQRAFTLGKLLACLILAGLLWLCLLVCMMVVMVVNSNTAQFMAALPAAAIYMLVVAVYTTLLTVMALLASVTMRRAAPAITLLAAVWLAGTFMLPRVTAQAAEKVYKNTTAAAFEYITDSVKRYGFKGQGHRDVRRRELLERTLKEYNVHRQQDLPIIFTPVAIHFFEDEDARVTDSAYKAIDSAFIKQRSVMAAVATGSPFMAMRNVSMALAGTDLKSSINFRLQAEQHRMVIDSIVNSYYQHHSTGGRELWERVPQFTYRQPGLGERLKDSAGGIIILAAWVMILTGLYFYRAKYLKI